jgi:hypothetical protein
MVIRVIYVFGIKNHKLWRQQLHKYAGCRVFNVLLCMKLCVSVVICQTALRRALPAYVLIFLLLFLILASVC